MLTQYVDGYQHIGIPTDDIKKTEEFYLSLGFKLKWATTYEGNPVKFFEYGNILIETYEKDRRSKQHDRSNRSYRIKLHGHCCLRERSPRGWV